MTRSPDPPDVAAARKWRERLRKNVVRRYLAKCKKILARYKGPGGVARYKTPEAAKQARLEYQRAYAAVYARTENGRRLTRKADKTRRKNKPRHHPKLVAEFYTQVLLAEKMECFYCKQEIPLVARTVDHWVPVSRGGEHVVENLRYACLQCNIAKGNKMPEEFTSTRA